MVLQSLLFYAFLWFLEKKIFVDLSLHYKMHYL